MSSGCLPSTARKRAPSNSAWRAAPEVVREIPQISEAAIEATIAYCSYLHDRYGRFPVYTPPFRTVTGFQASHLDLEFYDCFYRPEALSETQREHMASWHGQSRT